MTDFSSTQPALGLGFKIHPKDIIGGLLGIADIGNVWYVDGNAGSDTSYKPNDPKQPLATVSAALTAATANQNDVIVISPSGGSGRVSESTAIDWNKRFTHLLGNAAPTLQDARAGIEFATGGSLTISETGCRFANLTFFSSADIDETVSITGSYNHFNRVDFKGTSNATSADSTPWRALNINGGQENTFDECTFGADTYTRGAANATLELESAASRNIFNGCRFFMHNDTANTPVHVLLTGSSAIDRWVDFNQCLFYSFWTNDADKTNAVVNASAQTATGHVLLRGCDHVGFDDYEASASGKLWVKPYATATDAIGQMVQPTVT
jgi:hypothetical protein